MTKDNLSNTDTKLEDKTEDKKIKNDSFKADRTSDLSPTPDVVNEQRKDLNPDLGEDLARKAVDKHDNQGNAGDLKTVEKDGVTSVVSEPNEDKSDNGKVYSDARINPRDTNAPDAGLTPDGRRIAS